MGRKKGSFKYDREDILRAALELARVVGYQQVTRDALAAASNTSAGLISSRFGTMVQLRRAIMSAAVAQGDRVVLAQGLAAGDPKARAASVRDKREAVEGLMI